MSKFTTGAFLPARSSVIRGQFPDCLAGLETAAPTFQVGENTAQDGERRAADRVNGSDLASRLS